MRSGPVGSDAEWAGGLRAGESGGRKVCSDLPMPRDACNNAQNRRAQESGRCRRAAGVRRRKKKREPRDVVAASGTRTEGLATGSKSDRSQQAAEAKKQGGRAQKEAAGEAGSIRPGQRHGSAAGGSGPRADIWRRQLGRRWPAALAWCGCRRHRRRWKFRRRIANAPCRRAAGAVGARRGKLASAGRLQSMRQLPANLQRPARGYSDSITRACQGGRRRSPPASRTLTHAVAGAAALDRVK